MSTFGRVFGHAFGLFFVLMGAGFLAVALYEPWSDWLDENSTCDDGDCTDVGAQTTFIILGVSFVGVGLVSSLATEYAVRKTAGVMRSITAAQTDGSFESVEGIASFLEPFGIKIDPATAANVNVEHRTIDLRNQRRGSEVPTDPAGLSEYLKARGVHVDEAALRNATVVEGGEVIRQGRATDVREPDAPAGVSRAARSDELRLERATIVRKRDRGSTSGGQRLVEFELEVAPAGRVPYRVEVASLVRESLAGLLIEGSTLNVRVDPRNENDVTIDWSEN